MQQVVRVLMSIAAACMLCLVPASGKAWVSEGTYQPFPDGEATVIVHRFCLSDWCPLAAREWEEFIQDAVHEWDSAGSNFVFHTRPTQPTDDPCNLPSGEVAIIWTDGKRKCADDFPLPPYYGGVKGVVPALLRQNAARIYLYADRSSADEYEIRLLAPVILLHEFGHVLGLGHPDEVGQMVEAVMNTAFGPNILDATLLPDDVAGIQALYGVTQEPEALIGFLENPGHRSFQSGIGVISGWICDAEEIEIVFNGDYSDPYRVGYGTRRSDTEGRCGDRNNGFGLLFNWNLLGDGEHEVVALVDGVELGRATVTVTTLGEEFLRGANEGHTWTLRFPSDASSTSIRWSESRQNFVIVGHRRQ